MKEIILGSTGIKTKQNAFGALPIQRVDFEYAKKLLLKAYENGMTYFDTARAYSDSEEKIGYAFEGLDRSTYYLATKTAAKDVEHFWSDLNKSLENLKTDYIDVYQFHNVDQVYRPDDGTGMYEAMLEAKEKGMIRHIALTAHKYKLALEAAESGLYEVIMFPFSYLCTDLEIALVNKCKENNVGFVAMKALSGGLITNSKAAMAFIADFDNVLPIWGVQRENELDEFIEYMNDTPVMDEKMKAYIDKEREELAGDFCRGCGYCMPCPQGIIINQCARISQMVRRAPSQDWLNEYWQNEMKKVETCIHCNQCASKCPYGLNTPELLQKNYEDYQSIIRGETKI